MPKSIRRQPLWVEHYVSVVRCGHPRLSVQPTMRAFAAEKHVLVSLVGSGHAHQIIQRTLEAAIPRENVVCKVPIFIGAAVLAKHTDAIATLPASVATVLAKDLDLQIIAPRSDFLGSIFFNIGTSVFIETPGASGLDRCLEHSFERYEINRAAMISPI
jgi:DNA-binding transcriptional LysR family regulator